MSQPKSSQDKLRIDRNRELIRRMNAGENLTSFSSAASWFPPRPTIKKDPSALAQLYGTDRMIDATEVLTSTGEVTTESKTEQIAAQKATELRLA